MKEQLQPNLLMRNLEHVIRATGAVAALATSLYVGIALNEVVNPDPQPEQFELGLEASCMVDEELQVVKLDATSDSSAVFELSCIEPAAFPTVQSKPLVIDRIVDDLDPEIAAIGQRPKNPLTEKYTLEIAGRVTPESYIAISDKAGDTPSYVLSFEVYVGSDEHLDIEDYQVVVN